MSLEMIPVPKENNGTPVPEHVKQVMPLLKGMTSENGITDKRTYVSKGQAMYYGQKLRKHIVQADRKYKEALVVRAYESVQEPGRFYFLVIKKEGD